MKSKSNYKITVFFTVLASAFLAQIPNNGFENWSTVGVYEIPNSWSTLNNKTAPQNVFTATKGTPGSPGTAFLKLTSRTIGAGVVPGIAVCGKLDSVAKMPVAGYPFSQRPAYFNGKWQHMIFGNSQGSIVVLLSRWDSLQGKRDTVAKGITVLSGMAMSWSNFSFGLQYLDSLHFPDSCMIIMRASGSNPTNNDYLWVDNLSFSGTVAVVATPTVDLTGVKIIANKEPDLSVYPIPARHELTINFPGLTYKSTIQVFDNAGNLVQLIDVSSETFVNGNLIIETGKLPKGVYTLILKTGDSIRSRKVIIE